jgi:hypothetical protein
MTVAFLMALTGQPTGFWYLDRHRRNEEMWLNLFFCIVWFLFSSFFNCA